jgi:hypothetical protein
LIRLEEEENNSDRVLDKARVLIDKNKSYFHFAKGALQVEIKEEY